MKSSVSYHLLKIRSLKNNVVPWSDLWLSCVAVRVPTRPSAKLDKFFLRKVTKALRIFLRLKPLLHSTSKEQPIRQVMHGVKRWSLCRNSQVRQSGVGSISPEGWSPKWTTLAEASRAYSELISCGCKSTCRGLCKCTTASLPCNALRSCAGSCYQLCNNNLDRTKFYNGFTFFRTWVPCGFPYKPYIGICKAVYC